ncbi:MAG: AAA family ATPase [Actinomycetota bacterium]|nr:AAA family ATPase [Actinomycetota bacterium]
MRICPACGHENRDSARFCEECALPLAVAPAAREQRKTVTVVFCDVTGSTALGESTDPEALRGLLARYFERMKGIVESHGGTVEKFIGDAVMAVFGVPRVHEDDALRAARAACEMREVLPELGVQARIGVNTGEVVTGTEERLATGDAVNVAARLEQAAQPGEILIGEATLALVRDAVETEAVESLALKGKAEPVEAFRLVAVKGDAARRHDVPLVGREHELASLRSTYDEVVRARSCRLFTVVGSAGVGKSRLAYELLNSVGARIVRGRCLSYGEGITYWPVVEVVKQLGATPADPAAATSLSSLLRETDEGTSAEEIAWAFRKLLEEQAQARPLVCFFDDIQWAEETFLDLIEHVALLSRGAPILVLCLARPELAESRPDWPVALRLEPLPDADVEELIPDTLPDDLRERIARTSGGNPLFITQIVAMAAETEGEVVVPPTLKVLLAARLDQLESLERAVLDRAAIEGEIFHRGAIQALSDGGSVTPRLASLVRKGMIRPDATQIPEDDAFRFRHLLIRDAAYDALPKATRAELHERFADWVENHGASIVELDEILGYHLEQAAIYKAELGGPDERLALRAGERLALAGLRVLAPGTGLPAQRLLSRALELTRPFRLDVSLEVDFAITFHWDEPLRAASICDAAAERARAAGDERGEALARVAAELHRLFLVQDPDFDKLEALALEALDRLELDDHDGLSRVWVALGYGVANGRGRMDDWAHAAKQSIRHARAAGRWWGDDFGLTSALVWGPRPADEALQELDEVFPGLSNPLHVLKRAFLLAMLGRLDEAWALATPAGERLAEFGDTRSSDWLADIAAVAGDYDAAARYGQETVDACRERGHLSFLASYGARLGRWLCVLGRFEEAEPLAQLGREVASQEADGLWRQVQARVHAHRDEHEDAERLAREAIAIAERTDNLNYQGDALYDLAEVLAAAGRRDEAAAALEEALERYGRKKNLAMVAQVRPTLDELRKAAPI